MQLRKVNYCFDSPDTSAGGGWKKVLAGILLGGLLLVTVPLTAQTAAVQRSLTATTSFTLRNGLQVIVLEQPQSGRLNIRFWIDVPLHHEGSRAGLTELVGVALQGCSPELPDGYFRSDERGWWTEGPVGTGDSLMRLLSSRLLKPDLADSNWQTAKIAYLKKLSIRLQNPLSVSRSVARAVVFGPGHPYGLLPEPAMVNRLTAADGRRFYEQYVHPGISFLVIAGDITASEARRLAETHWESWPSVEVGRDYYPRPEFMQARKLGLVTMSSADSLASFCLAAPLRLRPAGADERIAQLLGQVLLQRLQQQWPDYTFVINWRADVNAGHLEIAAAGPSVRLDSLMYACEQELGRLRRDLVSQEELLTARQQLFDRYQRALEQPQGLTQLLLDQLRYRLPSDYLAKWQDRYLPVSAADLLEICQIYVKPDQLLAMVVADSTMANKYKGQKIHHYDSFGNELQLAGLLVPEGLTAETILSNYLSAIGGTERLSTVHTLSQTMIASLNNMELEMTVVKEKPAKLSIELFAGELLITQTIYDDTMATLVVMGDTQQIDRRGLTDLRDQALIFPEISYLQNGYTATFVASDIINATQVYVLDIVGPLGIAKTEYYDAATWLKVRTVVNRGEVAAINDYRDYRAVDGILFPFSIISQGLVEQPLQFIVESIELNQPVDAADDDKE